MIVTVGQALAVIAGLTRNLLPFSVIASCTVIAGSTRNLLSFPVIAGLTRNLLPSTR